MTLLKRGCANLVVGLELGEGGPGDSISDFGPKVKTVADRSSRLEGGGFGGKCVCWLGKEDLSRDVIEGREILSQIL